MTEIYKSFVDSNIWLYNFIERQDTSKSAAAQQLIGRIKPKICLSTQVINEVCFNLQRKADFTETQIRTLIKRYYFEYEIVELNERVLGWASDLRSRFDISFWDGLIVASALFANAEILYSEDMQNGLLIEDRLRIVNPFII